MSGFLLDTDTITLAQFGHANVVAKMASLPVSQIQISVISVQEQMRGWLGRLGKLNSQAKLADWYDRLVTRLFPVWKQLTILPFPEPAMIRFDHLRSLRLNIGLMDLRIAAVALEYNLTVVTRNLGDFGRVPSLSSEDWAA